MKQLLVEYIRTGNYALLADIKKRKESKNGYQIAFDIWRRDMQVF